MPGGQPQTCSFFQRGCCRYGDSCAFLHIGNPTPPPAPLCRFYLAGACAYGSACRFSHDADPTLQATSSFASSSLPHAEQQHAEIEQFALPENLDDDNAFCFYADCEEDAWDEDGWQDWVDEETDAHACYDGDHASTVADAAGGQHAGVLHGSSMQKQHHGNVGHACEHMPDNEAHGTDPGISEEPGVSLMDPVTDPADLPLCSKYIASGTCNSGEACRHIHGDMCETCGRYSIHPYNPKEAELHRQECTRRHDRLAAWLRSSQVECGICLERVLAKPQPSERRFGLLSCDHAFCLACIRNWRAHGTADLDTAVRACPVCRATTHFVVPSTVWPETAEDKEATLAAYKTKLGTIHCRHFAQGSGTCPFGTSCFYRHVHPDGREEPKDSLLLRRYMDQEGEVKIVSRVRLSDFLDTAQGRQALMGRRRTGR